MSIEALVSAGPIATNAPHSRKAYPDGWQPRSDLDTATGGYIVTKPFETGQEPQHEDVIREFGEDPNQWIVTSVRRSKWQQREGGPWLEAIRINMLPTSGQRGDEHDHAALMSMIGKWKPAATKAIATDLGTFVAPAGDLQLGKPDGGGTRGTVDRFLRETEAICQRLRADLPRGTKAAQIVLPWLGDCIEGVASQGGKLVMRLDLTPTQQVRVYRRLMWAQIKAFLPLAERIVIPVLPGNHDQAHRIGDKMATFNDDSWAIEGASAVMDGINEHDELGDRVSFLFPGHDELTICLDVAGTNIAMTHGHMFGRDPLKWWNDQAGGRQPAGDADVLLAAHSHHLRVQDHGGGRLFMQIPALDGGSNWFRHARGDESRSRMISFWTSDGMVRGLDPVT
ncbi:metallophosphatase family protein [Nocardioides sp. URHA0032]|uniref:metallophosphatase family protein n=1 Tax=Nocardioides sp. URHA0032 TaxID=1380388 RepID=UPI0006840C2E|nr:metallophosphatase family protein [Nocardioides sp. URHA0032]